MAPPRLRLGHTWCGEGQVQSQLFPQVDISEGYKYSPSCFRCTLLEDTVHCSNSLAACNSDVNSTNLPYVTFLQEVSTSSARHHFICHTMEKATSFLYGVAYKNEARRNCRHDEYAVHNHLSTPKQASPVVHVHLGPFFRIQEFALWFLKVMPSMLGISCY